MDFIDFDEMDLGNMMQNVGYNYNAEIKLSRDNRLLIFLKNWFVVIFQHNNGKFEQVPVQYNFALNPIDMLSFDISSDNRFLVIGRKNSSFIVFQHSGDQFAVHQELLIDGSDISKQSEVNHIILSNDQSMIIACDSHLTCIYLDEQQLIKDQTRIECPMHIQKIGLDKDNRLFVNTAIGIILYQLKDKLWCIVNQIAFESCLVSLDRLYQDQIILINPKFEGEMKEFEGMQMIDKKTHILVETIKYFDQNIIVSANKDSVSIFEKNNQDVSINLKNNNQFKPARIYINGNMMVIFLIYMLDNQVLVFYKTNGSWKQIQRLDGNSDREYDYYGEEEDDYW